MDADEAKRRIAEVLAVLRDANVPEPLAPTAFKLLWEAWSSERSATAVSDGRMTKPTSGTAIGSLAGRVGVSEEHLADIFGEEDDGSLAVRVPARQVSPRKATATIELALLACAGKQANAPGATSAKLIRDLCNNYGRLDGANFAGTMKSGDRFWQVIGKGADAAFALRRPGWDAAADLIRRLGASP